MTTLLLGFILLASVIAIMSIGVIMGRKPIAGSCGGIGAALDEKNYTCDICGGDPNKCEEQQDSLDANTKNNLSYDASENKADQ